MKTAADRVDKFCDEWEKMRGLHPEIIYGLHSGVAEREATLTLSDLRSLVLDSRSLAR